jgi:hypothetical protein
MPHIKLECVDLCGLGGVGGLSDPHRVPLLEKKHALLDKPPFLALERCVKNIIIFISRYTMNFSLHLVKEGVLIDLEPACNISLNKDTSSF